jgi:CheY-like chemotaxis protein
MPSKVEPKPKVLAVDDNAANLVALDAVLSRDYDVIRASSGAEAIAFVKANEVDVILMDVQMPRMDGYEAAAIIKTLPNCKDIPLIFITAIYREDPHVKRGYEVGAVDYFSKPFDPDILRLKVSVYASFRRRAAVLKERERQIRESEEVLKAAKKMSAILESLSVGVIISDTQGRICQTNDEVSRILKSVDAINADAYGEVLGWWDVGGQMLKDRGGSLAKALEQGIATRNEQLLVRCLDGSNAAINASTSPLLGLDGKVVGAVIVVQDLTEHRKIGEDFEQRITQLVSLGVELEQSRRVD